MLIERMEAEYKQAFGTFVPEEDTAANWKTKSLRVSEVGAALIPFRKVVILPCCPIILATFWKL